jgi:hypothetical protein
MLENLIDFQEVAEVANQICYIKWKRRLSKVERLSLQVGWEEITYEDFCDQSEGKLHISSLKSSASRVYGILGGYFGCKIRKSNFRSTFIKLYHEGKLNRFLGTQTQSTFQGNGSDFFCRAQELSSLRSALDFANCLSIWGASGVGKTRLVQELVRILDEFERIIWTDASHCSSLDQWLKTFWNELLGKEGKESKSINNFVNFLSERKVTIVIDNAESLISSLPAILNIFLLKDSASKLILIGKVKFPGLDTTEKYITFNLKGVENFDNFFESIQLDNREQWAELCIQYGGNIRELLNIANIIRTFFDGKVSDYLMSASMVLSAETITRFEEFSFSELDLEIFNLFKDSDFVKSTTFFQKAKGSSGSTEFFARVALLESYSYLVNQQQTGTSYMSISPILKQFLKLKGMMKGTGEGTIA